MYIEVTGIIDSLVLDLFLKAFRTKSDKLIIKLLEKYEFAKLNIEGEYRIYSISKNHFINIKLKSGLRDEKFGILYKTEFMQYFISEISNLVESYIKYRCM
jgi:hypothetical protein